MFARCNSFKFVFIKTIYMKDTKVGLANIFARLYLLLSLCSLAYVAILSLINPQATMDMVHVTLGNTDALSSIRGIYGGAGLSIVLLLVYLLVKDVYKGILFLSIFWCGYAISRVLTMLLDGALGNFGMTWLAIESFLSLIGLLLLIALRRTLRHEIR